MSKEEKENGRQESGSDHTGAGAPAAERGVEGNGDSSEASGGGLQGREQGSGQGRGASDPSDGGGKGGDGGGDKGRKIDLLQRIRAQRANGLGESSSSKDGASHVDSQTDGGGLPSSKRGATNDDRATTRPNRSIGRGDKQVGSSDGGSSEITRRDDSSNRISEDKPQGVKVKGVDKIKELAQKAAAVEPPKMRFQWDEKPLSNKEADEIAPKIRALLEFIFRHADKGISISNREKATARIWSEIDNEDLDIISSHLVEMGKGSKVVATAVRRMTNSYRLLQIGLITLPKFIQTYQFYAQNGGFTLGGK